jgi:hypothetical protein
MTLLTLNFYISSLVLEFVGKQTSTYWEIIGQTYFSASSLLV